MNKTCTLVVAVIVASVWAPTASVTAFADPAAADPAGADPAQRIAALNQQLSHDQAKLTDLNDRVERAQADLDTLNRRTADDQRRQAELSQQLSRVARIEYERPVLSLSTILGARSLDVLLSDIAQARLVARKQQALVSQADSLRHQDEQARDQQAAKVAEIKGAWQQAASIAARNLALRDSVQDAAVRARANAVAAQAQANAVRPTPSPVSPVQTSAVRSTPQPAPPAQTNAVPAAPPTSVPTPSRPAQPAAPKPNPAQSATGPVAVQPPGENHFAYGYCTWHVANKRLIPWYGNAIEWWPNAATYGYAEGQTPRVGAVMVTRESIVYGHVAYVESVNGDGSWTVSEMNYQAWNVVDRRTIHPGQVPLVGFIYGKAA